MTFKINVTWCLIYLPIYWMQKRAKLFSRHAQWNFWVKRYQNCPSKIPPKIESPKAKLRPSCRNKLVKIEPVKIKAQITFMSDFILYANKINSSKGSHLPAGHRKPSTHFLCRLLLRKVSQYQSVPPKSPVPLASLLRDLSCIKFGRILLSSIQILYKMFESGRIL